MSIRSKLSLAGLAGLPLFVAPGIAPAHHSFAALFDLDAFVEVEGAVSDVRWVNPHIKLYVESAEGETWEIEAGPTNLLSRMGIERGVIAVGDRIRVRGNPGRRAARTVWVMNVLLTDNREILANPDATPFYSETTLGDSTELFEQGELGAPAEGGNSIFKVWTTVIPSMPLPTGPPQLTAEGQRRQAPYDRGEVPFEDCEPPGMPLAMGGPYPIELVDDGDRILIRMESYDQERVVHLTPPAETPSSSPLGFSQGRWEDDRTLAVETTGIDYGRYGDFGPAQSDQSRVLERFELSPDGLELAYEITITDQIVLGAPWTWSASYFYREGESLKRWNCGG